MYGHLWVGKWPKIGIIIPPEPPPSTIHHWDLWPANSNSHQVGGGKEAAAEYQHHRYAGATLLAQAREWKLSEKSSFYRTVLALVTIGL